MENYNNMTLLTIRARKAELQKDIDKSSDAIKQQWKNLFHSKQLPAYSPTQRFLSIASSSAGIIDGALFGWKIYRKFKRK